MMLKSMIINISVQRHRDSTELILHDPFKVTTQKNNWHFRGKGSIFVDKRFEVSNLF